MNRVRRAALRLLIRWIRFANMPELTFSIGADEWVAVKGTDLKAIPVGTFATEVKQSRLLTYLSDVGTG